MATAQLAVQRSGQLVWLRRAARQLWTLSPGEGGAWTAARHPQLVGERSWLVAERDGNAVLASAPFGAGLIASGVAETPQPELESFLEEERRTDARIAAWSAAATASLHAGLRHPRTGHWFLAGSSSLSDPARDVVYPIVAVALALSSDQHRLYAVTAAGDLYVLAADPSRELPDEASRAAPELVLSGLAAHGAPSALALGPAGLVLATDRAVVGINLRSRSVAPILADLAAHPLLAELRAPAVAMDHHRHLYLADEQLVVYASAHGAPPTLCARAS